MWTNKGGRIEYQVRAHSGVDSRMREDWYLGFYLYLLILKYVKYKLGRCATVNRTALTQTRHMKMDICTEDSVLRTALGVLNSQYGYAFVCTSI